MNFFIFAIFCSIAALAFAQDTLPPGTQLDLNNGQKLFSADGRFRLDMQSDGNLVMYTVEGGGYRWSTGTAGSGADKAVMQQDGQFCLYNRVGELKWSTYTRDAQSVLKLQNDGNLVVYNALGRPVWNAGGY
jgi:hypothetical protein